MKKQLALFKKYFLHTGNVAGPVKQTDFAMYLEPVDLEHYKKQLFSYPFTKRVLKTVSYKGEQYEIFEIDIKNISAKKNLLIFAATHGNEFASALVILDFLEEIDKNPKKYLNWNIRIVTPINPVGVAYQSRYNEDGKDINRDFKHFQTTGAKIQKEAIQIFQPDVVITLHEGPQKGFFVIAESNTPKELEKAIIQKLKSEKIDLAKKSFFGMSLQEGLWHKSKSIFALQRLLGIYTLGRYVAEKNIILFTTESSWSDNNVERRKKPHMSVINAIVEYFR